MAVTLDRLSDVTLDVAWRVGFDGEGVIFADRAKARIRDCREAFERLSASDVRRQRVTESAAQPA